MPLEGAAPSPGSLFPGPTWAAGGATADDDTGESGVALLLAAGPFAQPWTVELHDVAGGLLRSHPFKSGRSS